MASTTAVAVIGDERPADKAAGSLLTDKWIGTDLQDPEGQQLLLKNCVFCQRSVCQDYCQDNDGYFYYYLFFYLVLNLNLNC